MRSQFRCVGEGGTRSLFSLHLEDVITHLKRRVLRLHLDQGRQHLGVSFRLSTEFLGKG